MPVPVSSLVSSKPSVFIVGREYETGHVNLFTGRGWNLAKDLISADLVHFVGGADVSPYLYNKDTHPKTHTDPERDRKEVACFNMAVAKQKAITGVCRGGQLANIMVGGEMYQHVDGHLHSHAAADRTMRKHLIVSSSHHQMMIPAAHGEVILVTNESTRRESMKKDSGVPVIYGRGYGEMDVEAIVYKSDKILCFQPHPEYPNSEKTKELFFSYIDSFLL